VTEPTDPDLIALATPYALHSVPESELADIERQVGAAPPAVAQAFADEVRAVRETMAVVSAATAVEWFCRRASSLSRRSFSARIALESLDHFASSAATARSMIAKRSVSRVP